MNGVWFLVGTDEGKGRFSGLLEIRPQAGALLATRVVSLHETRHPDGRRIDWVWTGQVNQTDPRAPELLVALRRADFVPRVGELVRTEADSTPLLVRGEITRIGGRWLKIKYRSQEDPGFRVDEVGYRLRPLGEQPIWRSERFVRQTHPDPSIPFEPPNPIAAALLEAVFGTPSIDKALLFEFFASYHQLSQVSPFVDDPRFQDAIHFQTIDRTDFAYYRRHPGRLRVIDKVLDRISLAETEFRADAFRQRFAEKAEFYQEGLSGDLVGEHGMVVRGIDPEGLAQPDSNSALWTGVYVYTQALRYQTTGEDEAFDNVRRSVRGLLTLMDITDDPTTFARTLRPSQPVLEEDWRGGEGDFVGLDWLVGGNNDMAKGLVLGMLAGWQALPEGDPLRVAIRAHALALLKLGVFQPQSRDDLLPSVNPGIALLMAGILNPDLDERLGFVEMGLQWFHLRPLLALAEVGGGPFYIFGLSDWSGNHLTAVSTLVIRELLAYTDDLNLKTLWNQAPGKAWRVLRELDHPLHAALAVASGALDADPEALAEATDQATWGLRGFPAPKPPYAVDYGIREDFVLSPFPVLPWKLDWLQTDRRQRITAPPMVERGWDQYLWNDQQFSLGEPGSGEMRVPGVDYLFLYWVVRAGEVIPTTTLCDRLGAQALLGPRAQRYRFDGIPGETVEITLEVDLNGVSNGGRAALRLGAAGHSQSVRGTLPLVLRAILPARGPYRLSVAKAYTGSDRPFAGDYCLRVSSSEEAALTVAAGR